MRNNFSRTAITLKISQCLPHSPTRKKPAIARGVLATAMALSISGPVIADTFIVTNTQDSGAGSLREAITLANANPGEDIIELSSVSGDIATTSDLPYISDDLNIIGPGPDVLAISSPLSVVPTSVYSYLQVNISGLKTTGISTTGDNSSVNTFGSTSKLTVDNCVIANGGVGVDIGDGGSIVMSNSLISGNSAGFWLGGGFGRRDGTSEHLQFSNTTITDNAVAGDFLLSPWNTASFDNCRITNNGSGITGRLTSLNISNTLITENNSHAIDIPNRGFIDEGTGFFDMSVNITNSMIKNNQGDGVNIDPGQEALELTFSGSTLEGNSGSGISFDSSSSSSYLSDSITFRLAMKLMNSTISSNNRHGVNFYSRDAANPLELNIENSTISNNKGIGIRFQGHTGTINNTTITGNLEGGSINSTPAAAFINYEPSNDLKLTNTIIAGNTFAGSYDLGGTTIITASNSLIQNPDTLFYPNPIPGDNLIDVNPLLGSLSDNGGTTKTHALLTGSPAIDAADNASCTSLDQRGIARPQDGNADGSLICDMGAYELNMTGDDQSTIALNNEVKLNGLSAAKPGPTISASSNLTWTHTATNTGNTALHDVAIRVRQKSPVFGDWQTPCLFGTLEAGEVAGCAIQDLAVEGPYIALVVLRGMTSTGDVVESTSKVFYQGKTAILDPRLATKRNIALDVLEAKGFDQATHDTLLAEINAATRVSELHAIIVRMRSGTINPPSSNPRLDTKRNIAIGVLGTTAHDEAEGDALLAEINAATSVSELHAIIVRMRSGNVSTTPQLALSLAVTANGSDINRPGASIPAGSAINWTYTVTNEGNGALQNIVITQRQKLPSLGEWATPCTIASLDPGATESCNATTTAIADNYKALIVARSTLSNGDNIEDKVDAFYRH